MENIINEFKNSEEIAFEIMQNKYKDNTEHSYICSVYGQYKILKDILKDDNFTNNYIWLEIYYINNKF